MPGGLIELIEGRADAIVDRFVALLRQRRGSGENIPSSALRDHIPPFLAALADALRSAGTEPTTESSQLADAHGALRWEQGFEIREVVGDYAILHEAILCEAEAAGIAPSVAEQRRLVQQIAGGIAAAVEVHVALQAERERVSSEQLERVHRMRHEILSILSHELRTPLHVINLCTQLLRAGVPTERLESSLAVIERNVARETRLVDELLDMASLVTGRIRLSWSRVDVAAVAKEAVAAARPVAEAKRIHLHDEGIDTPAEVHGDRARLYQCVWQLVLNALKFTPSDGHVWVSVHLQERKHARQLELAVKDTGVGVSEGFASHVFDPFAQEDRGTMRTYDGLGLGLSLVRHIVELHGGSIDATSDASGTTFRVRLPPHR